MTRGTNISLMRLSVVVLVAGTPPPHAAVLIPQPQPAIPALSAWGLVVMTLLMLTAGTLILRPRVPVQATH